jgi:hypothetical protein
LRGFANNLQCASFPFFFISGVCGQPEKLFVFLRVSGRKDWKKFLRPLADKEVRLRLRGFGKAGQGPSPVKLPVLLFLSGISGF